MYLAFFLKKNIYKYYLIVIQYIKKKCYLIDVLNLFNTYIYIILYITYNTYMLFTIQIFKNYIICNYDSPTIYVYLYLTE